MLTAKLARLLLASLLTLSSTIALADLKVIPTRVVLEKNRATELTLINQADETKTYRIFFRNMKALENGTLMPLSEEETEAAKDTLSENYIRFSPKQVSIEPKSYQRVRVMARKPKGLAAGEYRSHLVFRALPKTASNPLAAGENEMSISIQPILEIVIPAILRHGELSVNAAITDVKFDADLRKVDIFMSREGNRSLYGEVKVLLNNQTEIGYVKGIAFYTPNTKRSLSIPVELPESFDPSKDSIQVQYIEDEKFGGNLKLEASAK